MSGSWALLGFLALGIAFGCAGVQGGVPDGPDGINLSADLALEPSERAAILLAARAEDARLRGDWDAAQAWAERALRLDGGNPFAFLVLARTLAQVGEREAALRLASEAEAAFRADAMRASPSAAQSKVWERRAAELSEALKLGLGSSVPPRLSDLPHPGSTTNPVLETDP